VVKVILVDEQDRRTIGATVFKPRAVTPKPAPIAPETTTQQPQPNPNYATWHWARG